MGDLIEKHLLSKSTFVRGLQCVKSLYLYKNFYFMRDPVSAERKALFSRGTDIGQLAQKLFPGGIDVSPPKPSGWQESVLKTQELISKGIEIIYEAAFQHEQVLAAIDILVKRDGKWYAYEVKSSTRIMPVYINDAALQYYVITGSGLVLEDISIVNINNQYLRNGKVEVEKLFNTTSVKKEVLQHQEKIKKNVALLKNVLLQTATPQINIGEHCFSPYPCDFMGNCWKDIPKNSVFNLSGLGKSEQFELFNSGVMTINDIPENFSTGKWVQLQIEGYKTGKPYVEKSSLGGFISSLRYPLYFMDFETFMPAVPIYDYTKPFQHVPFQYSLHLKKNPDGELLHYEFLGEAGIDPRKEFIDRLLEDIGTEGDVLVYSAAFERSILNSLKKDFPEHTSAVDNLLSRIKDLMQPFEDKWYYHPAMKGSYSIKSVLPALVPELRYEDLTIGSGSIAMSAFEALQQESDMFKIADTRTALLEYCKMDTLAMVRILEVLVKAVG